uniref:Uncharacterized protein n=1 Tax=Anguilla anguilla TaxID=7936 RepID=A0A0E9R9I3_ANGAN
MNFIYGRCAKLDVYIVCIWDCLISKGHISSLFINGLL